jgi:hypothetical protein
MSAAIDSWQALRSSSFHERSQHVRNIFTGGYCAIRKSPRDDFRTHAATASGSTVAYECCMNGTHCAASINQMASGSKCGEMELKMSPAGSNSKLVMICFDTKADATACGADTATVFPYDPQLKAMCPGSTFAGATPAPASTSNAAATVPAAVVAVAATAAALF